MSQSTNSASNKSSKSSARISRRVNKTEPLPQYFFASFTGDRSGSMTVLGDAGEKGLYDWYKTLNESAKDNNQTGFISVTTFNNKITRILKNVDINTPFSKQDAHEAMKPRGTTCLYDCAVTDLNTLLSNVEKFRNSLPRAVKKLNPIISMTWVCCTDGIDNASKIFSKFDLNKCVKRARENGVKCLFIATNQDAVLKGEEYGFNPRESMTFSPNKTNADAAFRSVSQTIRAASLGSTKVAFTPTMRTQSVDPRDTPKTIPAYSTRERMYMSMTGVNSVIRRY